jgi:hypothetical protein
MTLTYCGRCGWTLHLAPARADGPAGHGLAGYEEVAWIERNFGYAVAHAYAGHTDGSNEASATATYVRASVAEVAAALAALTGEPHPLATIEGW